MWSKIKFPIFQWFSNSYQSVSTEIKEVERVNTEISKKNRQGYILIFLPFCLSRTFFFNFLSKVFPSLFDYISKEVLHSVYMIQEMEASLNRTEREKENLKNELEFYSKKLTESIADKNALEKKYDEMDKANHVTVEKQKASRNAMMARKYANIFWVSSLVWGGMFITMIMSITVFTSIVSYDTEMMEVIQKFIMELLAPFPATVSFVTTVCVCLFFW